MFTPSLTTVTRPASRPAVAVGRITAVAATLLVAGELIAIDVGLARSLRGTFDLGARAEYVIAGIGGAAVLWAVCVVFRAALRYERDAARGGAET